MPILAHAVCVFCGARPGARPEYMAAARALGTALGQAGHTIVYGAGDNGLMGEVARAGQAAGTRVMGFIPRHLVAMEVGKHDLDALVITETMHERKKLMFCNSDAVVVLPGGVGTLDELVEILSWRQLGLHGKPTILIDTDGYWQPFLTLVEHMIDHDFVSPGFRDYYITVPDAEAAVAALRRALS